jgi:hypothetical protein
LEHLSLLAQNFVARVPKLSVQLWLLAKVYRMERTDLSASPLVGLWVSSSFTGVKLICFAISLAKAAFSQNFP